MRGTNLFKILIVVFGIAYSNHSFSQENKVSGRYIAIDNIEEFIVEKNGLMVAENFNICNFPEEESSKPAFLAVSEIGGVVKFSVESSSSTHVEQRKCRIVVKPESWKYTLRNAFLAMNIEYILVNDEFVGLNDYFNSLK